MRTNIFAKPCHPPDSPLETGVSKMPKTFSSHATGIERTVAHAYAYHDCPLNMPPVIATSPPSTKEPTKDRTIEFARFTAASFSVPPKNEKPCTL